ncbi:zinc finger (ccch type) motif-containing protein, partial [Cystoisospora suis]
LGELTAHEDGDISVIRCLTDQYFLTCGAEDSVISIWKWSTPHSNANTKTSTTTPTTTTAITTSSSSALLMPSVST